MRTSPLLVFGFLGGMFVLGACAPADPNAQNANLTEDGAGPSCAPAGGSDPHACDPNDKHKTTICHIPPGNPANAHTLCVGNDAVEPHLMQHGDYLGSCSCKPDGTPATTPSNPAPTPSPSPTPTPTPAPPPSSGPIIP